MYQLLIYNGNEATNRDLSTVIAISLLRICDLSTWHSAAIPAQHRHSTHTKIKSWWYKS